MKLHGDVWCVWPRLKYALQWIKEFIEQGLNVFFPAVREPGFIKNLLSFKERISEFVSETN